LLLLAVIAVAAAVFVLVKSPDTPPQRPPAAATDPPPPATAPTTVGSAKAAPPEALVGRWQRTDGDYALDIRRVRSDGQAEAAYFNPGPINVSRAEVKQDGSRLILFVELRDVDYPGSTYMLAYEPGQDALMGSYYQPASGNTYEVAFLRQK
jgi:hypothetical protein